MPVLRLLVAGLVAVVAIGATLFAGAIVIFTGLVGFILQLFRPTPAANAPRSAAQPRRQRAPHDKDVIDVEATEVSAKR